MTPAERAQLTRSTRTRRVKSMVAHPSFQVHLECSWLQITNRPDMIIFKNEVNARLTGGAEV